jgi:hypothetical protein
MVYSCHSSVDAQDNGTIESTETNPFTGSVVTTERGARKGARVGRARIVGCDSPADIG